MFGNKKTEVVSASAEVKESFEMPSVVLAMVEKNAGKYTKSPSTITRPANTEPSVLSAGAIFRGILTSPGPVHAKGKLEGELSTPHFTLAESGTMTGKLQCKKFVIDGKFDGDLVCDETFAGSVSVIAGTIVCKSLQAAPGASISGKVEIGSRDAHHNKRGS
ncbi:MAG: polymer-forming cytoskeletal protein [Pseudohongiella sp.]|nr:polymer-forming cytoskeletal protein [Pseudohongiella sp.]